MRVITTEKAPKPLGHYSQAIACNGLLFISGQLPLDPQDPSRPVPSTIEEQMLLALKNLKEILSASGSSLEKVVKVTLFIADITLWAKVNEIYGEFFGSHRPARSAVPTKELPRGCLIEIEAIAAV